jgi:GNAT superfamily N-acetyltransferase
MLALKTLAGEAIAPHLQDVARLRIAVFRDFPYLYDGDADYERTYLARYARAADSVFVLAFDGAAVVGAATGMPLAQEDAAFRQPFLDRGMDVDAVFYFGESVLLPAYRGRGIGHRFFDLREGHARALGTHSTTAFAAVDRSPDDPRRPPAHRDNDAFWRKRGYERQPGMTMRLAWKEIGESVESEKPLTFWLRALPARELTSGPRHP